MPSDLLSKRAYAVRCKVSEATIRQAVSDGKISKGVDKDSGKIKPEVADEEWFYYFEANRLKKEREKNGIPDYKYTPPPPPPPKPPANGKGVKALFHDTESGEDLLDEEDGMGDDPSYLSKAELERQNEAMKLKHARLKYAVAKGELLKRDDVYRALFNAGLVIKSAIQAIPDRVIDDILAAGLQSRGHAHLVLTQELNKVLTQWADMDGKKFNLNDTEEDEETDGELS